MADVTINHTNKSSELKYHLEDYTEMVRLKGELFALSLCIEPDGTYIRPAYIVRRGDNNG